MHRHSRREFLRWSVAAGSAAMLGPIRLATAQEAAAPLQMCIARWKDAPLPETGIKSVATKLTEQAINALGGMKRFVGNGDVVWVKPNMAWDRTPEQAANTNPDVVATLVRLSLDAGAKTVKVGDRTCNEAKQSYPKSGIEAAVKAVDGEVVYLDDSRFKKVALNGVILKEWELYPEIIEADLVINVPVVKHHNISNATLCMKNYMGVISGNRGQWHQDLPNCLCDVTAFMKPRLCVLDAVRILTAHGPTGGNLEDVKRLDTIAAGTDIVALDSFGAELLGHPVGSLATVVAGEKAGLGIMDYHKIAQEIGVS